MYILVDDPNREIDLSGIQCFQNLTDLTLVGLSFKDLSPISALSNIQSIELRGTSVISIDSFKNLSKINYEPKKFFCWMVILGHSKVMFGLVNQKICIEMGKRPRIWTDHVESFRLLPFCAPYEKKFLGAKRPEENFW